MGTTERLSSLRGRCLIRDRHRCVISRKFDAEEADQRFEKDGKDAKDDDGKPIFAGVEPEFLEVAHIIPHALASSDDTSKLLVSVFVFVLDISKILS